MTHYTVEVAVTRHGTAIVKVEADDAADAREIALENVQARHPIVWDELADDLRVVCVDCGVT